MTARTARSGLAELSKNLPSSKMAGLAYVVLMIVSGLLACTTARPKDTTQSVVLEPRHDIGAWKRQGWTKLDRIPADELVLLTFALKQRNLDSLEKLFWRVSNPSSAQYGQHLSLEELTDLISPSTLTLNVIDFWLAENGITEDLCKSIQTKDFLECNVTRETAERMLPGAMFFRFSHPRLHEPVIRSAIHYSVPSKVAPHLDFIGGVLRFPAIDWARPKVEREFIFQEAHEALFPKARIHVGVYPSVLRERYNVSQVVGTNNGTSQCVAQFLEQYFSPSDLAEFFKIFGGSFVHLDAIAKVIGPNTGRSGIEASLDTQYIMSLGSNITTWFWSTGGRHQSQEPFLEWMVAISNMSQVPWVHSVSYGDDESSLDVAYMTRINTEFQKGGVRGLSFLFASGDNGAGCKKQKFNPSYPASSPYVTTVGGTAFDNPFAVGPEYAYDISGGGFSNVFKQPSYQTEVVQNYLKTGPKMPPTSYFNPNGRGYPDVAALSNHFWIVNNFVPVPGVAGTSAATPTFAGIVSLLNDARFNIKKASLGFLNPFLYKNPGALYDITSGCHEGCLEGDRGFCATKGWDAVSGFGSPNYPDLKKAALQ